MYVDYAKALKSEPEPLQVRVPAMPGMAARKSSLPAVPPQALLASDVKALTKEALLEAKQNQDRLYKELKNRLTESLEAELAQEHEELKKKLLEEFQTDLDKAYNEIRAKFEAHSLAMGPLVHRLAWLAGFPDPDPKNRRTPRGTYIEKVEGAEAAEIRPKIDALRAEYDQEIRAILAQLSNDLRADLDSLDLVHESKLTEAGFKAAADAEAQAKTALIALEESAFDTTKVLAGIPGLTVQRPAVPGRPEEVWTVPKRSLWPQKEKLRSEALIFARARGWRLSENATNVPNKTKEFLEWRNEVGLTRWEKSPN